MGVLRRLAENLLAQFVWQVLFSGLVATVEAVTFWQVVANTPPLAVALVFLVALAAAMAALRFAARRRPELPPHAQKQEVTQARHVTQQQARAEGGGTVIQGARDAIGTQYLVHATPAPFDGVPHLMWSGPFVERAGQGYELRVTCKNSGRRTAYVMVGSRVSATARMPGLDGEEQEGLRFVEFSVPGFISPVSEGYAPFALRMHCERASSLPEREVVWRIIYTDDDGAAMGFITECSATVTSYLGRLAIAEEPPPALDNSSRAERNDSYQRYMASRTGGTGSTGPRRTDW